MKFPIIFKNITIRLETSEDAAKIKDFHDPLIDEKVLIGRRDKRSLSEWQKNVDYAMDLQDKNKGVFVLAEQNQKIVGLTAVIQSNQKMDHFASYGIMLSKEFRKIGLGTKISEIGIEYAIEKIKGLECIELGVAHINYDALKLYHKLGFRIVAVLPNKIKHSGLYLDELMMQKWVISNPNQLN